MQQRVNKEIRLESSVVDTQSQVANLHKNKAIDITNTKTPILIN
jgi:hypothetical protein